MPRQHVAVPAVFGMAVSALALGCACLSSAPTFAQPKANNDYYTSAGTEYLRSVDRVHVGPAIEKLRSRQYESAFGDVDFTLHYFPNHPQGLMTLIELCKQWKSSRCNTQEAFENAVAVNPNVAATYVLQGIYLYGVKQLPAAVASLEKALTLDPNSLNAHYNLGLAYLETKQFELANAHAQRAYQLGAPLPGLRDKLMRAGQWKPIDTPRPDAASSIGPEPKASPAPR